MTDRERELCLALGRARKRIASFDKRFSNDMAWQAQRENPQITDKQARMVHLLAHRYRRQIPEPTLSFIELQQVAG